MNEENEKLEKVIKLVEKYKAKVHEKSELESKIKRLKKSLENFMDTGNKYIFVEFAHGAGSCEQLYPSEVYPSEAVRETIRDDVLFHIQRMERELTAIDAEILNLGKWITSGE